MAKGKAWKRSDCRKIPDVKAISENTSLTYLWKSNSIQLAQTEAVHEVLIHFLSLLLSAIRKPFVQSYLAN